MITAKGTYYEMWSDGTSEFAARVSRMLKLGYKLHIIPYVSEYQQSQILGSAPAILSVGNKKEQ